MVLDSSLAVFIVGVFGGIANEVLHWWNLRESPNFPEYARSWLYWLITIAMVLIGGGLAWIQLGSGAEALVAFELGLAAPLVLQKLTQAAGTKTGAMGTPPPSPIGFLKGV